MKSDKNRKDKDYVWRFKLTPGESKKRSYSDKITEMVRSQIKNLLDIVILTQEGQELKPDSFRFLNDEKEYRIF